MVKEFYRILRPGGLLHLCRPHRLHPRHQVEILDRNETGGHVRSGYTEEDYRALLEPVGFQIQDVVGIGTPGVYYADRILRAIFAVKWVTGSALPLFPFTLPFVRQAKFNPYIPFSLYTRAVKPADLPVTRRVLIVTGSYVQR